MRGDREALLFLRSQIVLTSPLANLAAPIDDLRDVENEAKHARHADFGAKRCVPRAASACAARQFTHQSVIKATYLELSEAVVVS